jgi:Protein of unknown function (DUF3570)
MRLNLSGLLSCAFLLFSSCDRSTAGVTTASSALYSRADTNATTVWSPRMRVAGRVGESLGVESAIALDAWTGASVDVVTAATKAVTEVRREITAGGYYALPNVTVGGGYRYSTENDYWSNGGVGTVTIDLADKNTTIALAGFGSRDTVGRSGDPGFREPQSSAGGRVAVTQIVDADSLVQLSWETTHVVGYQASPYRFVAVGGDGTCRGTPSTRAGAVDGCGPERVPDERYRHAATARGRRAFGEHVSVGLEYRYYFDSWSVNSHTVMPDIALRFTENSVLSFDYRYYTQGEADFYKPRYLDPADTLGYRTRDRELSALYSNRVGFRYQHDFELGGGSSVLTTALRSSVTRYKYLAFVGLSQVDALEATLLVSLGWR